MSEEQPLDATLLGENYVAELAAEQREEGRYDAISDSAGIAEATAEMKERKALEARTRAILDALALLEAEIKNKYDEHLHEASFKGMNDANDLLARTAAIRSFLL